MCLHNSFKQQLNLSVEILQLDLEFIVVQDRKSICALCAAFACDKQLGFNGCLKSITVDSFINSFLIYIMPR